jgi:hypothetical protein
MAQAALWMGAVWYPKPLLKFSTKMNLTITLHECQKLSNFRHTTENTEHMDVPIHYVQPTSFPTVGVHESGSSTCRPREGSVSKSSAVMGSETWVKHNSSPSCFLLKE